MINGITPADLQVYQQALFNQIAQDSAEAKKANDALQESEQGQ